MSTHGWLMLQARQHILMARRTDYHWRDWSDRRVLYVNHMHYWRNSNRWFMSWKSRKCWNKSLIIFYLVVVRPGAPYASVEVAGTAAPVDRWSTVVGGDTGDIGTEPFHRFSRYLRRPYFAENWINNEFYEVSNGIVLLPTDVSLERITKNIDFTCSVRVPIQSMVAYLARKCRNVRVRMYIAHRNIDKKIKPRRHFTLSRFLADSLAGAGDTFQRF